MKQRKDTNTIKKTVYQRYTQKQVLFGIAKNTLICLQNTDQRCVTLDIQIVSIGHIFLFIEHSFHRSRFGYLQKNTDRKRNVCVRERVGVLERVPGC